MPAILRSHNSPDRLARAFAAQAIPPCHERDRAQVRRLGRARRLRSTPPCAGRRRVAWRSSRATSTRSDRRLAAAGLSLRLRRSAGSWEQTLKAPAGGLAERLEETVLRPGRWGAEGPPVDPSLHDGTAAGQRLREVLSRRRSRTDRPRAGARLHGRAPCDRDRRPRRPGRGRPRPRRDPGRRRPGAGVRARVRAQGRRSARARRLRQGRRSRARAVAQHAVESGPRRPPGARRSRRPAGEGQAARAGSRHDGRGDLPRRARSLPRPGAGERDGGRRRPSDRRVDPPAQGRHPPRPHRLARARAARAAGRAGLGDAADRGLPRPRRLSRSQHRRRDPAGPARGIGLARAVAVAGCERAARPGGGRARRRLPVRPARCLRLDASRTERPRLPGSEAKRSTSSARASTGCTSN